MATYYRPPGRFTARSTALTPWGNGLLLTTWPGPLAYNFDGTTVVSGSHLTPVPLAPLGALTFGFVAAAETAGSDAWIAGYFGGAIKVNTDGTSSAFRYSDPSDFFSGVAYANGHPYFLQTNGAIHTPIGGTITPIGAGFAEAAVSLTSDGTKLYAALPNSGQLGTFTFSGPTSGTATKVATPMTMPASLAASASGVAVAGWDLAVLASGASALAAAPNGVQAVALQPGTNLILLLGGTDPNWTVVQAVSGTGTPIAAAWTPTSEQILVSDQVNGRLAVYNLLDGLITPTPAQNLAVASAAALGITPDGLTALVCRPALDEVSIYTQLANVWSFSASVGVVHLPNNLVVLSNTEVAGSYTPATGVGDGVFWIADVGAVWGLEASVTSLGYSVSGIAADLSGTVYTCGTTASGTGVLTASAKTGVQASTTWTGRADFLFWEQGQVAVGDSS